MSVIHQGKKAAGEKAIDFISSGMIVGLGTGSTAYWAIEKLGERVAQGLEVSAIATSIHSREQAQKLTIPLVAFSEIDHIDVDIDGADEIDENFNLIKGGGGALLREKIIASASRKMIVVADDSKLVKQLGWFPLPVEVIPFGWQITLKRLQALQADVNLRKKDDDIFVTDNGNYIFDCHFGVIASAEELDGRLKQIPGVVESGLFIRMCDTVIVGYEDGTTTVKEKE